MKRIIEYHMVLTGISKGGAMTQSVIDVVNSLIKIGWQPYGSPMFTKSGAILQAVVKYEEE
jgi:hypothetical protein